MEVLNAHDFGELLNRKTFRMVASLPTSSVKAQTWPAKRRRRR